MPQHPIASLFARIWGGTRASADTDAGDMGTAFGMEMSLLEAETRSQTAAPAPQPGRRWLRRRGRAATTQGRN
jgi:hypothetical protein